MSRTPEAYTYNVETLVNLSGWPRNRVYQDITREGLDVASIRDVAVWLSANGGPELRAEMAKRLIPSVLGSRRRTDDNERLFNQASSYDLMLEIMKRDQLFRAARVSKIRKVKRKHGA